MTTDVKNAADITAHLRTAMTSLNSAQRELQQALALAKTDYPHNDQALQNAVGGLHLVQSTVAVEVSNWHSYLIARMQS